MNPRAVCLMSFADMLRMFLPLQLLKASVYAALPYFMRKQAQYDKISKQAYIKYRQEVILWKKQ